MTKEKLILAYSGGLDTSVAIAWLKKDYDVIAVCMDVGEGKISNLFMTRPFPSVQLNRMFWM